MAVLHIEQQWSAVSLNVTEWLTVNLAACLSAMAPGSLPSLLNGQMHTCHSHIVLIAVAPWIGWRAHGEWIIKGCCWWYSREKWQWVHLKFLDSLCGHKYEYGGTQISQTLAPSTHHLPSHFQMTRDSCSFMLGALYLLSPYRVMVNKQLVFYDKVQATNIKLAWQVAIGDDFYCRIQVMSCRQKSVFMTVAITCPLNVHTKSFHMR